MTRQHLLANAFKGYNFGTQDCETIVNNILHINIALPIQKHRLCRFPPWFDRHHYSFNLWFHSKHLYPESMHILRLGICRYLWSTSFANVSMQCISFHHLHQLFPRYPSNQCHFEKFIYFRDIAHFSNTLQINALLLQTLHVTFNRYLKLSAVYLATSFSSAASKLFIERCHFEKFTHFRDFAHFPIVLFSSIYELYKYLTAEILKLSNFAFSLYDLLLIRLRFYQFP